MEPADRAQPPAAGCGLQSIVQALLGPNIHRAILRVGYDRRIAGRARGFDVFDDRASRKRQQLLIIKSTAALRASVRRHEWR